MEKLLGWSFIGKEKMTGLPEYRNGSSPPFFLTLPSLTLSSRMMAHTPCLMQVVS